MNALRPSAIYAAKKAAESILKAPGLSPSEDATSAELAPHWPQMGINKSACMHEVETFGQQQVLSIHVCLILLIFYFFI